MKWLLDRKIKSKKQKEWEPTEISDYMGHVKTGMRWMAMLPIYENPQSLQQKIINYLYYLTANLTSLYIFAFSFMDLMNSFDGDLFRVTYNLVNTVIYACNTLYLLYFQCYQKATMRLINSLNTTFRFRSAEGLTRLDMTESFLKAKNYSIGFVAACIIGALNWVIMPFFHKGKERVLPVKIWYPINIQPSPIYEIAYISQVYGQILVAVVYANFGNLFLSICVLICGQFDILCCSLRNLRYTALLKNNYPINKLVDLCGYDYKGPNKCTLPEDERNAYFSGKAMIMEKKLKYYFENGDSNEPKDFEIEDDIIINNKDAIIYNEFHDEVMSCIKDCVIHHQHILKFCADMEEFFNPICLVKMGQITLLACFLMYASSVSFKVTLLEYLTLTIIDLFVLCYFGNEVIIRSCNIVLAVCTGPWTLLGKRCLKSLMPMLIRSSRPVGFTGGKFYTLTLENFIAVSKLSFSYFTVLRNVNENSDV